LVESAPASRFGHQGSVSVGAERLFGVSNASQSPGSSVTTFSLLGGSGLEAGATPYGIPRIGVDGFLSDGLSLGLGAEFAIIDQSGGNITVVGLNPRVGYALHASDGFSLWPRVGISYVNMSVGSSRPLTQTQSAYLLAGTIEIQIVVTPLPHFGFLIAPTLDIGLAATSSTKITQIGLQAGLIGWF